MKLPSIYELDKAILAGHVNRFHTTPSQRLQTIGEHSYGVALWVHFLEDGDPPASALMAALTHDIAEIFVGDMPAQTKWKFTQLAETLKVAEAVVIDTEFPAYDYTPTDGQEFVTQRCLIHLADKFELLHECLHEIRLGNLYCLLIFVRVVDHLHTMTVIDRYQSKLHEALQWFLNELKQINLTIQVLPNSVIDYPDWLTVMSSIYCEPGHPMENHGSDV